MKKMMLLWEGGGKSQCLLFYCFSTMSKVHVLHLYYDCFAWVGRIFNTWVRDGRGIWFYIVLLLYAASNAGEASRSGNYCWIPMGMGMKLSDCSGHWPFYALFCSMNIFCEKIGGTLPEEGARDLYDTLTETPDWGIGKAVSCGFFHLTKKLRKASPNRVVIQATSPQRACKTGSYKYLQEYRVSVIFNL